MRNMFLKRIIILLLVLAMIPLVACKDNGEKEQETVKVSLPIADFSIVRPIFTSVELVTACNDIASVLNQKLGSEKVKVTNDKNEEPDDKYEIIIGATKRKESTAALEELNSDASMRYVIKLVGRKIVIIGSDDVASVVGAKAFCEMLSGHIQDTNLVFEENYTLKSDPLDFVQLVENGEMKYAIIRPQDSAAIFTDIISNFRSKVVQMTGASSVKYTTDYVKSGQEHDAEAFEILIGNTNYNETKQFKEEFGDMAYGIRASGNKLVVYAPSPDRLSKLLNELINLISSSMTGKKGTDEVNVRFLCEAVKQYTEFGGDVPTIDGAELQNASYAKETDTYTMQYRNATAEQFTAYRTKLESAGYTLTQENRIGDNLYATYKNDKYRVHFYYTASRKIIIQNIYSAKSKELPSTPETYEKICTPTFTQLANLNVEGFPGGMGYVFRLEDSTFIIVDGGSSVGNENSILYNKLRELNVRPDGKIIVRAWFITHGHNDHYNVLKTFSFSGHVTVEHVVGNYISADYRENCDTTTYWDYRQDAMNLGSTYVNFHTGQQIAYAGCTVTAYFTCVDLLPTWKIRTLNDTCLVFMVELGGQKIFIGADVETLGSDTIASMYEAADLKCDFMQVCHHGYYGGSTAMYGKLNPEIVVWPAASSFAQSNKGIEVNKYLINNLNVKEMYIAGDGEVTFELPYTPKQ